MKARHFFTVTLAAASLLLAACDSDTGGGNGGNAGNAGSGGSSGGTAGSGGATGGSGGMAGSGGGGALKWYTTCGDPACGMPTEDPALEDCVAQMEGDPCSTAGESCEIAGNDCNINLVCADTDPKGDPNTCPRSQAKVKHEIDYLTDSERERIREEVITMPLATWKYNWEGQGEKEHLGFIIEDQPPSSAAVRPNGERVDLYGYTSMAVAAIQAQERELSDLRREVQALREALHQSSLNATCAPPSAAASR